MNNLSYSENKIAQGVQGKDYEKVQSAFKYEMDGNHETVINLWIEILGEDFQKYG